MLPLVGGNNPVQSGGVFCWISFVVIQFLAEHGVAVRIAVKHLVGPSLNRGLQTGLVQPGVAVVPAINTEINNITTDHNHVKFALKVANVKRIAKNGL